MAKIISIDKKLPHFGAFVLCLFCDYRWTEVVNTKMNVFRIQCPKCKKRNTFVSVLPNAYLREFT